MIREQDTFAKCIRRADDKMYQNKEEIKQKQRKSSVDSDEK